MPRANCLSNACHCLVAVGCCLVLLHWRSNDATFAQSPSDVGGSRA
jgi:hypothetical protein